MEKRMRGQVAGVLFLLFVLCFMFLFFEVGSANAWSLRDGGRQYGFELVPVVQHFEWKEFDTSGNQLLKEEGWREGIEARMYFYLGNFVPFVGAKYFGGDVDYDGHTQSGVPVSTKTKYLGYGGEFGAGYRIWLGDRYVLFPFASIEYDRWFRDLESTPSAIGYTEEWRMCWWKVGSVFEVDLEDSIGGAIDIGVYGGSDFFTRNRADVATVDTEPKGKTFWGASLAYKTELDRYGLGVTVSYEYKHWTCSADATGLFMGSASTIAQPDSKEKDWNIMFNFYF